MQPDIEKGGGILLDIGVAPSRIRDAKGDVVVPEYVYCPLLRPARMSWLQGIAMVSFEILTKTAQYCLIKREAGWELNEDWPQFFLERLSRVEQSLQRFLGVP